LGFGFQIALLGLEPDGALRTIVRRTLSRTDTSYLTVAASDLASDPLDFRRGRTGGRTRGGALEPASRSGPDVAAVRSGARASRSTRSRRECCQALARWNDRETETARQEALVLGLLLAGHCLLIRACWLVP
jgi:hypothetical protein